MMSHKPSMTEAQMVTIVDVAAFPPDYLRVLVDASYDRAIAPRRPD